MCEYCEGTRRFGSHGIAIESLVHFYSLYVGTVDVTICDDNELMCCIDTRKWKYTPTVKINFCPMCGRRLRGDAS